MVRTFLAAAMLFVFACGAGRADQNYHVAGKDTFVIGDGSLQTTIAYDGTERLRVERRRGLTHFRVDMVYSRTDAGGTTRSSGAFAQDLLPSGSFQDRVNDDPDYLAILNQPFAIVLDAETLRDLRALHGHAPVDIASPLSGGRLSGYLQRAPDGSVNGRPAVGVSFIADGAMAGAMPDRPNVVVRGTIHMDGNAYYDLTSAMLLALDATLTIDGTVRDRANITPVHIVYRRTIRASD